MTAMVDDDPRYRRLASRIRSYESAVVAYSGGVDSTLVAVVAHRELGARALAVTGISASLSSAEQTQATELARRLDLAHRCVETHEMARPEYRANAGDRCFHCKSGLFERLRSLAEHEGYAHVLSGDNLDDVSPGTHRPGMRAAAASQRAQTSLNSCSIFRARPSGAVTRNVAGSGFLKVAIMRRHSSSSRPSCCL